MDGKREREKEREREREREREKEREREEREREIKEKKREREREKRERERERGRERERERRERERYRIVNAVNDVIDQTILAITAITLSRNKAQETTTKKQKKGKRRQSKHRKGYEIKGTQHTEDCQQWVHTWHTDLHSLSFGPSPSQLPVPPRRASAAQRKDDPLD